MDIPPGFEEKIEKQKVCQLKYHYMVLNNLLGPGLISLERLSSFKVCTKSSWSYNVLQTLKRRESGSVDSLCELYRFDWRWCPWNWQIKKGLIVNLKSRIWVLCNTFLEWNWKDPREVFLSHKESTFLICWGKLAYSIVNQQKPHRTKCEVPRELKATIPSPMKLFCDNKAAIEISHNSVLNDRTKHVEVDKHFFKRKIEMANHHAIYSYIWTSSSYSRKRPTKEAVW